MVLISDKKGIYMKGLATLLILLSPIWVIMAFAQKATVAINNIDANTPVYYTATDSLPLNIMPINQNVYVQLLGGPVGGSLTPIFNLNGESAFQIDQIPGYFNGGIGMVPGVIPGGFAEFELRAWQGKKNDDFENTFVNRAITGRWAQQTGVWNDQLVPQPPPTGESMLNQGTLIFHFFQIVPEPSNIALLCLGMAVLIFFRPIKS
jgi:hypothetical protein